MAELSILIPARNEMFLKKTIEDILEHREADTEIIVILDGAWAEPGIPQHERVIIVYLPQVIGQRAASNVAARLASGKYLMKVDAHCSFDQGFDRKMLAAFKKKGDNVTMVPTMKNLWAFDWVCPDGHRRYQSPSGPCKECKKPTERVMTWKTTAEKGDTARAQWRRKNSPSNTSYRFDSEPHFQYFGEFAKRPEGKGDITESMSIQGSCFMLTKENWWKWDICDESIGSWGSQGIEVACKTWLSGGKVLVNQKTWYAHLFRTQGGDFSFPYEQSENKIQQAKKTVREIFFNNAWPQQKFPLSWLVKKFWPVPGWTEEDLKALEAVPFGDKKAKRA